jgi:dipeptidyl aminopeptidase/acylaminoacyl peptidase
MSKEHLRFLAAGFIALLILAACSGGDEPTATPLAVVPTLAATAVVPTATATLPATIEVIVPTFTPEPPPTAVPDPVDSGSGNLVFINGAGEGLFAIRPDGSGLARLYDLIGVDRFLAAASDGSRLALQAGSRLLLARADGSALDSPADLGPVSWVRWSPDNGRLALLSATQLVVLAADGATRAIVSADRPLRDAPDGVAWSPDGSALLFICDEGDANLCLADSAGVDPVRTVTAGFGFAWYREPRWAPDGSRLSFVAPDENDELQVYLLNPDGSGLVQVTAGPGQSVTHAWSPTGTEIVVARTVEGSWQAQVVAPDGTPVRDVTGDLPAVEALLPLWSPAGDALLLIYTAASDADLITVALRPLGGPGIVLAGGAAEVQWSPDGAQLAVLLPDNEIQLFNAVDGSPGAAFACTPGCANLVWLP